MLVGDSLEVHGPQCHSNEDEKRIIGNVVSDACALPEPERDVSLATRLCGSRDDLATRIEEPPWIKPRRVVTIGHRIMVAFPKIRKANRSFWDEHSLVPVVLCRAMWDRKRERRSPSENLFDNRLYIRKARDV